MLAAGLFRLEEVMIRIERPKVLYDPMLGVVDIRSVQPMVDAPQFQLLRDKRQLSLTDIAFPGARHSRFEHSIGAFSAARRLGDRWVKQGFIDMEMRRALMGYALYHDIGHAAYSHVTEDFCGEHKVRTRQIVAGLRDAIEASDINFGLMYSLIAHEHPLHLAVSDKNIGVEKLDYLERDAFYTGVGMPEGVEYLRKFMYYVGGTVAIDEKMVDHAIGTMDFYMKMYKNVYLRKCLVIAQRTFHKMLSYVIVARELDPKQLPDMTDPELMGKIAQTTHRGARSLYLRLRERRLLKEAVVLRSETGMCETRILAKRITVIGIPEEDMQALVHSPTLRKDNHAGLERLETRIANVLGIEPCEVAVVPAMYADRFKSTDVMICGSDGGMHSLRARRPKAFESMEETARSYWAVRVCVPDEYRERTHHAAEEIHSVIKEMS
jgi:HD superfamily phosphohydrolase